MHYIGADTPTIMAGELSAIERALLHAVDRTAKETTQIVEVRFDSQEAWAQLVGVHRGSKHLGLQSRIHQHMATLRGMRVLVIGTHIPSHRGEPGNEAAD